MGSGISIETDIDLAYDFIAAVDGVFTFSGYTPSNDVAQDIRLYFIPTFSSTKLVNCAGNYFSLNIHTILIASSRGRCCYLQRFKACLTMPSSTFVIQYM